jgi:hypothetical protein
MRARVKDEGRQGRKIGRATQRAGSEFSDPPEQNRDYEADSIPTRGGSQRFLPPAAFQIAPGGGS